MSHKINRFLHRVKPYLKVICLFLIVLLIFLYLITFRKREALVLNAETLQESQDAELVDLCAQLQEHKEVNPYLWNGDLIQLQETSITGKTSVSYMLPIVYVYAHDVPSGGMTYWFIRFELLTSDEEEMLKSYDILLPDFTLQVIPDSNTCIINYGPRTKTTTGLSSGLGGSFQNSLTLLPEDAAYYTDGTQYFPAIDVDLWAATRDSDLPGPVEVNGECILNFTLNVQRETLEYECRVEFPYIGNVK